jgi:CheY-like chemotaxis protein
VKPEEYHQILVALDQALQVFPGGSAELSPEDRKLQRHLELVRSVVLKAESGHPFPLQTLFPDDRDLAPAQEGRTDGPATPEEAAEAWARRIRVMIVDDHDAVRAILRALLAAERDFDVIAEATNGKEAVELAAACHPDIVIMDLNMPVLDGVSATRQLLRQSPESKVVIFSANREPTSVRKSIDAGAVGYLCKPAQRRVIIAALRDVHAGRTAFQEVAASADRPIAS